MCYLCYPGSLYVNGKQYTGESPGDFVGMDRSQNLYLGGVPDYNKISRAAGYNQGYVGEYNTMSVVFDSALCDMLC